DDALDVRAAQQVDELFDAAVGVADGKEGKACACHLYKLERASLVRGNVLGLVAFDLVLGLFFRSPAGVALVVEVTRVDLDDLARDAACFRVPSYMVADLE